MGSINKSHNEADGGILLFNGELILLYCDSVQCEIGGKESVKSRVYLTTHRLIMIVTPYRQNSSIKSLCAPFCAITKCNVEQPIFGANYIEATVRDESDPSKSFSFKLKFSKGGAVEFAMAMNRAVSAVGRNYNPSTPAPSAYTPAPSAQYYQAPPTVYAPGYNCGIQMPVQQFPDQPPIGFIYASSAPPPYPGLGGNGASAGHQQPSASGYPSHGSGVNPNQTQGYGQQQGGYPQQGGNQQQQPSGYPGYQQQQPGGYYPQQAGTGYPQQPPSFGYAPQQPASSGYPGAQTQPAGYPAQPPAYPGAGSTSQPQAPPQQKPSSAGYPDLSGQTGYPGAPAPQPGPEQVASSSAPNIQQPQQASWPSAPSYNPNWQEDKKSA